MAANSNSAEIKIGNQTWMSKNLEVTVFRNGDEIPEVKTNKAWKEAAKAKQPAWCYYENEEAMGVKYGKLYNWYAVMDPRGLAPDGWQIPSQKDWDVLVSALGKENGIQLKSEQGWMDGGNGTNASGFNLLPGGQRGENGMFLFEEMGAYLWTCNEVDKKEAHNKCITDTDSELDNYKLSQGNGLSVRCVKEKH